jgi:superfamily II DNA/RNA helicase
MFSATFSTEVRGIAKKFMNEYYFVSRSAEESTTNANITHEIVYLEENDKLFHLHDMLQKIKGLVISNY